MREVGWPEVGKAKKNKKPKQQSGEKKKEFFEMEGVVVEALPNAHFRVKLDNGITIIAYLSGKMRMNYIRVVEGDRVKVEISPYDLEKGRITYRIG